MFSKHIYRSDVTLWFTSDVYETIVQLEISVKKITGIQPPTAGSHFVTETSDKNGLRNII